MSEFDPEKVERLDNDDQGVYRVSDKKTVICGGLVHACDYDQLLVLYNECLDFIGKHKVHYPRAERSSR